jgi:hypothetical protein
MISISAHFRRRRSHPSPFDVMIAAGRDVGDLSLEARREILVRSILSKLADPPYCLPFGFIRAAVDGGTMPLDRRYPTMFP